MANFPGVSEIRVDARTNTLVHFDVNYNDAAGTYTIPVKAGTFVHEIGTFVKTAFTTSGANASLTAGDGDSAHGYLDTGDTALETIDTAVTQTRAAGEAYAGGKYYAVDDTIDFVFVPAAAGATAGRVIGYAVLSHISNAGLDA